MLRGAAWPGRARGLRGAAASAAMPASLTWSRWSTDTAPNSTASSVPPPELNWSAWSLGTSPWAIPASKTRRHCSNEKAPSSQNASQNLASPRLAAAGIIFFTIMST